MKPRHSIAIAILAVLVVPGLTLLLRHRPLVLTGIVTTDDVIVSSEIQGRLQQLDVNQGDHVKRGQLLGLIAPAQWQDDLAYFDNTAKAAASQVNQAAADLKFQEQSTRQQVKQAEANLAATEAQAVQAAADLENLRLNFERAESLHRQGANSAQEYDQARTAAASAQARVDSLHQQVDAARAAVELSKAGADQIAGRRAALATSREQAAAATAQKHKAGVLAGYTEIKAPVDGIVDVRAALQGEVINAGQPIVTLIDPDNLWIRADIEESYIDRVHLGDTFTIRLPSGAERTGTVYFRGVDADYATQRDVSRTKRDIKTFEIRLRCDNRDRSLVVGLTAYVLLPFGG